MCIPVLIRYHRCIYVYSSLFLHTCILDVLSILCEMNELQAFTIEFTVHHSEHTIEWQGAILA